jgi:uncharacterized protein YbjQ (UPF0145 family)
VAAEKSHAPLQKNVRREASLRLEERARKLAVDTVVGVRSNPPNSDGKTVNIRRRP